MAWLELRSLCKRFAPVNRGAPEIVVGPLNLLLEQGTCLAIVGPSGSGKTTLLRLVAGLETASAGSLWLDGREITSSPAHERPFTWVSQEGALYPQKTIAENIRFALERRRVEKPEDRLREMAALLRLEDRLDHFPVNLSGGERQRAALARALVVRPQLLLLDEPLASLDAQLRLALRREITPLLTRLGVSCIWVTHDQAEAFAVGQQIAVMHRGALAQIASPEVLLEQPVDAFVAGFAGDPPINLIRGVVSGDGGGFGFVLDDTATKLRLPLELQPIASALCGQKSALGIREHHLEIVPEGSGILTGTVTHVEHAGREWVMLVAIGRQTIAVRDPLPRPVGAVIHLQIPWEKARLFAVN